MKRMNKIIIGIAGESGSGKDTVTGYLAERYGASHHKFSEVVRDIVARLGLELNRKNMDTVSMMLRQTFGEDTLSRVICHDVEADGSDLVVMDGVRRESDLKCVRNVPGFVLLFVETSLEKRYERIAGRRENADDASKTFEAFLEESKAEPQMQVRGLKEISDHVIANDGTLEELYAQADRIMGDLLARSGHFPPDRLQ